MDSTPQSIKSDNGVARVGGYTSSAIAVFSLIVLAAILWALFGPSNDPSSPIIVACVFGILGLAFAFLGVRWNVRDGYLKVSQWGIPRKISISDISSVSSEDGMRWKQGVGIRWIGPGEWAMLCGTDEIVTIVYGEKKFIFSVDEASDLERAVYSRSVR